MKMEFEINEIFYLSEGDEEEILESISKGHSVDYAVRDFINGLDDCLYYFALAVEDKIIEYIKTIDK
jgi:hypothetical protein